MAWHGEWDEGMVVTQIRGHRMAHPTCRGDVQNPIYSGADDSDKRHTQQIHYVTAGMDDPLATRIEGQQGAMRLDGP
jgi:hypothetical protein